MNSTLRIGTRDSQLAIWQANFVKKQLFEKGIDSELVLIKSQGDLNLKTPLYEMGIQGVFTKSLDIALLNHQIDIAVHSLKDIPTVLAENIMISAVLKRDNPYDALIYKNKELNKMEQLCIATGSVRRRAFWIHQYQYTKFEPLRGNINSRLKTLEDQDTLDAIILAAAGIDRIALDVPNKMILDWMTPSPAQGTIAITTRADDPHSIEKTTHLNHSDTMICTSIERSFLRQLMGGCSMPIGALAKIEMDLIHFEGCIATVNGEKMTKIHLTVPLDQYENLANRAIDKLFENGGKEIIDSFKI